MKKKSLLIDPVVDRALRYNISALLKSNYFRCYPSVSVLVSDFLDKILFAALDDLEKELDKDTELFFSELEKTDFYEDNLRSLDERRCDL